MPNLFPKNSNDAPRKVFIGLVLVIVALVAGFSYWATPAYTNVGYQPVQPVPYDHYLHVEQLGLDCRYCHFGVDRSAHAGVPTANTCMNCHSAILTDSAALAPVRHSYESGDPIQWVRIHKLPDYVYFNHAAHVNRGISCVSCHGEINMMPEVYQAKSLTMTFCLDCHRNPAAEMRPLDQIYNLSWKPVDADAHSKANLALVHDWRIHPPQSCSGCHR